jgi:hypothetical protein
MLRLAVGILEIKQNDVERSEILLPRLVTYLQK